MLSSEPGTGLAPTHDPSCGRASAAHLRCLGPPRLLALGQALDLAPRLSTPAVEFLLRVIAAGPAGARLQPLEASLWPALSPRSRRARTGECLRGMAVLAGERESPIRIEDERAFVDESALSVDSLDLERAIAPLLVPFARATVDETERARRALSHALASHAVFLPAMDAPWAVAARLRIADALARATACITSGQAPSRDESPGSAPRTPASHGDTRP